MKIQSLTLRNFKGIREFTITPNGDDIAIFGNNATGKTTVADAYFWILFGKNSLNQSDFEVKTLDRLTGQPIHNLSHEVESLFLLDNGETVTLKKVYAEKWVRKRGAAQSEFTGHSTDHYINGVPVKANEYRDAIDGIAGREETFRLLTNPQHFAETIKWQDRRRLLLEICGDISDADVIASDPALAALRSILGNRTIDQHKKVIAAKRTDINKEMQMIPARIDEAQRSLPVLVEGMAKDQINQTLANLRAKKKELEWQISMIQTGGQLTDKANAIKTIDGQLIDLKNKGNAALSGEIQKARAEKALLEGQADELRAKIRSAQRTIAELQPQIGKEETALSTLRGHYAELMAKTFAFTGTDTCAACGQSLPVDQVETAKDKALADFNRTKSGAIEQNRAEGMRRKGEVERMKGEIEAAETNIGILEEQIADLTPKIVAAQSRIDALNSRAIDATNTPEYRAKLGEKSKIEAEISALKDNQSTEISGIQAKVNDIDMMLAGENKKLAQIDAHANTTKRIAELGAQEKTLAAEFERLEQELFLCEQFIRTKVSMLTEKINSRFRVARFKLFNTLINGGLEECCEITVDGVPYGGGLNNGMRINVGLDVINTLSEHYKFEAPIVIDNAESVTELLPTRGQQIRLYVSAADQALRVEQQILEGVSA